VNSPANKNGPSSVLRLLAGALVVVYIFSRLLPCVSPDEYPVTDSLENSWTAALHLAWLNHLQFGSELIFTYGPWGFLARGYHPETFPAAMASWFVLATVFIFAGWRVARGISGGLYAVVGWLATFALLMSIPAGEDINTRLIGWGLLLLVLHFFVEDRAITLSQALLAITFGWLGLVKFTGLVEGALVVAIISVDTIFRHRRFPWIALCWLGGVLFFWWLAGQKFGLLGNFLRNSAEIAGGYTEAMMLGDRNEVWRAAGFIAVAVLPCALVAQAGAARLKIFCALPVLGMAALLFIGFKLGYVRSGWQHETTSALALVLAALACLLLERERPLLRTTWATLIISVVFAGGVFARWFPEEGLPQQVAATLRLTNVYAPIALVSTGHLPQQYAEKISREQKQSPLPHVGGGADLYAYDQSILFANEVRYQPRPVLQSYSAYTPRLAELDAAHLRGTSAASNIFFAVQTIDGRFPPLDDAPSWLELLSRYEPAGTDAGFLHLVRAAVPRRFNLVPLTNNIAQLGQNFRAPRVKEGLLWVEMDIKRSLAGRVANILYKPTVLVLTVRTRDGAQKSFRLVPGMARAGFLLSPFVGNTADFAALAGGEWRSKLDGRVVESITISEASQSGFGRCYEPQFTVRFSALEFSSREQ